jgi:hypothetical protein
VRAVRPRLEAARADALDHTRERGIDAAKVAEGGRVRRGHERV